MSAENPENGDFVACGGSSTNAHELGDGRPVVLFHGSGPGVSASGTWRLTIPEQARDFRVIAPDMAGLYYMERQAGVVYDKALGTFDAPSSKHCPQKQTFERCPHCRMRGKIRRN